ncbi:WhiB family transcriptional regulator [Streptomyces sp. NPDC053750]|uniref:WhiB family transcriptional regulator n=1 Tax=Streptomyces sp. NPDC053750 TaxID=3365714 RepID=UPI0037D78EB5
MTTVKYWQEDAACRGADADELFAESTRQKRAKAVCERCPVRIDCLVEALDNRIEWGVWGGMTERERRALLRRRPGVASWRHVLDSTRVKQQQPQPS